MSKASLVLVGSGIKFVSHLTNEAKAYIEQSDKVLYLLNDPAMKKWVQASNPSSESLDELYVKYALRLDCYRAITEYILQTLRVDQHVCVVLYGHPNVFSMPGLDAVKQARAEGYFAQILPGISAEDCLYADLLIDPGSCGCQSFEATDFLIHSRRFDTSSHLILWQIDAVGVMDNSSTSTGFNGIRLLLEYLSKDYDTEHEVIIYEAAQYPHFSPRIEKLTLGQLPNAALSRISTLYIPPSRKAVINQRVLDLLNINYGNKK